MRLFITAALVTVAAILGSPVTASAAPKDYCADLKGSSTGGTCEIQLSDPAYIVDVSMPLDYPDQEPVADYISKTRETFLNAAKSGAPHDKPYELRIKPTEYTSAIPPRGTQTVVFKAYNTAPGAQPQTTWKAFNWDQTYRKAIVYSAPKDDKKRAPLWRVDDPLTTVAPIVAAELQKQQAPAAPPAQPGQSATTPPPPAAPIVPAALNDPANYQNFAVVNEGVIFFFDQGAVLPESAGAVQVLVPRSAIDPLLA